MSRSIMVIVASLIAALGLLVSPSLAAPEHGEPSGHASEADHGGADAGHGDGHGDGHVATPIPAVKEGLAPAITALVVFAIVMFILSTKVWPLITGGLDERNAKIREEIASAEAARAQAKAALDEYEQSLSQARIEAQKMLDETRTEQARLAAELKTKAERELNEMREKAKRDIDGAKKAALGEIYAESVSLATQMAGKILRREVSVSDQERMLEESLAEMSKARSN